MGRHRYRVSRKMIMKQEVAKKGEQDEKMMNRGGGK